MMLALWKIEMTRIQVVQKRGSSTIAEHSTSSSLLSTEQKEVAQKPGRKKSALAVSVLDPLEVMA